MLTLGTLTITTNNLVRNVNFLKEKSAFPFLAVFSRVQLNMYILHLLFQGLAVHFKYKTDGITLSFLEIE